MSRVGTIGGVLSLIRNLVAGQAATGGALDILA